MSPVGRETKKTSFITVLNLPYPEFHEVFCLGFPEIFATIFLTVKVENRDKGRKRGKLIGLSAEGFMRKTNGSKHHWNVMNTQLNESIHL